MSWGCEPVDSARCTMRSCRLGLTALDVAKQLVAGRVEESCGGEVVECHSDAVELLEGDTGAKIARALSSDFSFRYGVVTFSKG